MGWSAPRVGCEETTPSPDCSCVHRGPSADSYGSKRARAARHGSRMRRSRSFETEAADLRQCRRGRASANGMRWSASSAGREDNHAKSARARVLRGPSAGYLRGEVRAGRAALESNAMTTTFQSHSRRLVAVSVRPGLGQQRGDGASRELARTLTTRKVFAALTARVLCTYGRCSMVHTRAGRVPR